MHLTVGQKIIFSFVVGLVFIAGIGLFAYQDLNKVVVRLGYVETTDDLSNSILEARRLEKNYLLYHDAQTVPALRDELQNARDLADSLDNETALTGAGRQKLRELTGTLTLYEKNMDRLEFLYKGGSSLEEQGSQSEAVREAGRQLQDLSRELSREQRDSIADMLSDSKRTIIITSGILLVLGIIVAEVVARGVAVPLRKLAVGTRQIASGEFIPVEGVRSHDEVGQLVDSFNIMGAELEEKQEQLIQAKKLASLGTLTSGVAHELNNPLNNILTSAEILMEDRDRLSERQQKLLGNVQSQTDRARRIVQNLLDFSRERTTEFHIQELEPIVRKSLELVGSQVRLASIEQHLELSDHLMVCADERQLQQVLVNLILNAVQAMPSGGNLEISACLSTDRAQVVIQVRDTGEGIPYEDLSRVFDPFFTTKEAGAGTGLGLSVSYGIIEKHGGQITVDSEVGEGSTFTIRLPVPQDRAGAECPHVRGGRKA